MRAIRIESGKPNLVNVSLQDNDGVRVRILSSSICGSDLHLMTMNFLEGRIPGHEFAGVTDNGQAVAIEPLVGCGQCHACEDGLRAHCDNGAQHLGVMLDGGMAEYAIVPEACLVPLPSGLDISTACLVEPLSIALRGLDRIRATVDKRCLVVGAGPIGLAAVAAAQSRGLETACIARYPHQAAAAERLGAEVFLNSEPPTTYTLVIDAVGSTSSLQQACSACAPLGQICMLGTPWQGTQVDFSLQMKEVDLISATGYRCASPNRTFTEAARLLYLDTAIADALISHRLPLDAATEAFAIADSRAEGALKVAFDMRL